MQLYGKWQRLPILSAWDETYIQNALRPIVNKHLDVPKLQLWETILKTKSGFFSGKEKLLSTYFWLLKNVSNRDKIAMLFVLYHFDTYVLKKKHSFTYLYTHTLQTAFQFYGLHEVFLQKSKPS